MRYQYSTASSSRPEKWRIKLEQTSGTSTYSFTCIHYMKFNALIRHVLEGELSQRPKTLQGLGGGVDSCWHLEMHVSHMLNRDRCKNKKANQLEFEVFVLFYTSGGGGSGGRKSANPLVTLLTPDSAARKSEQIQKAGLSIWHRHFQQDCFFLVQNNYTKVYYFYFFYLVKTCNRLLEITICTLEQKNWNRICFTNETEFVFQLKMT